MTIPCPGCGWYQRVMIPFYRRRFHRWMMYVSFALFPVGLIAFIVAVTGPTYRPPASPETIALAWGIAILSTIGCVGLVLGREVWALVHQPNKTSKQARIKLGRKLAQVTSPGDTAQAKVGPPRKKR